MKILSVIVPCFNEEQALPFFGAPKLDEVSRN